MDDAVRKRQNEIISNLEQHLSNFDTNHEQQKYRAETGVNYMLSSMINEISQKRAEFIKSNGMSGNFDQTCENDIVTLEAISELNTVYITNYESYDHFLTGSKIYKQDSVIVSPEVKQAAANLANQIRAEINNYQRLKEANKNQMETNFRNKIDYDRAMMNYNRAKEDYDKKNIFGKALAKISGKKPKMPQMAEMLSEISASEYGFDMQEMGRSR